MQSKPPIHGSRPLSRILHNKWFIVGVVLAVGLLVGSLAAYWHYQTLDKRDRSTCGETEYYDKSGKEKLWTDKACPAKPKPTAQRSQYCFASDQVCIQRPEDWKYMYETEHLPHQCLETSKLDAPIICWSQKLDGSDLPSNFRKSLDYATLVSQTPIGDTGVSDVQLAHRLVHEETGDTGYFAEEFLVTTAAIAENNLQLGLEIRLPEMKQTFTVPLTSTTMQEVYLLTYSSLDPATGKSFTSLQAAVDYFNHPDALIAHEVLKNTKITSR